VVASVVLSIAVIKVIVIDDLQSQTSNAVAVSLISRE